MLNQVATRDRVFHALSDPSRRLMVERLSLAPASVSELAGPLSMSLAALGEYLKESACSPDTGTSEHRG